MWHTVRTHEEEDPKEINLYGQFFAVRLSDGDILSPTGDEIIHVRITALVLKSQLLDLLMLPL